MALLRKKKSTFDESDLPTDNWIWGNSRGGGGAPLKDVQGNDVANLKKVLAGTIEVDHSPSPNSKGRRNNRNSEFDDDDNNYGRQNNRNNANNAPNRNNGGGNRNRQAYDQDDDADYDRRGGRTNSSQNNNNFNHNNHPSSQSNQNAPRNNNSNNNYNAPNDRNKRFNPYSDEAPDRVIPGLNDQHSNHSNHNSHNSHNNHNDPVSPRYVNNNNGASPKKFMGSLRELNGGAGERDAKQRKQAEYQEMLRQQIEENNKKKDKEKREQDEVKRRELAEFMATQPGNKGGGGGGGGGGAHKGAGANSEPDYPPAKKSVPRFRADSDDYNDNSNSNNNGGGGGNKIPGLNMGGGKGPALNLPPMGGRRGGYSDDEEPPRRNNNNNNNGGGMGGGGGGYDGRDQGGRSNGGGRGGGRGRSNSYDSQDDEDHYRSDDSRGRGAGGTRGGGGGRGGAPAADVVPVEEYDELSKLVDRLLTEKAQLQLAVDKQADQLKALKGGKGGAAAAGPRSRLTGSPSKPTIARSKSAIQPRERGGGSHAGDTASEEPPRAASNLRVSKKELDRERAREAKANLKQYEPLSKNARNAKQDVGKRPSSMHAMGSSKAYQNDDGGVKKAVKVAFGSNRNLDKNNAGAASKLAQQGAAVVKGGRKHAESPSKDNTPQGRYGQQAPAKRVGGGGMAERDNIGVNGFAKLQQANSRVVGGPVMVVHDEEEPSNRYSNARTPSPLRGNNNRGGRGLELRGNSEYIPISGDRDSIGNDQLEKLLRQSRNAR